MEHNCELNIVCDIVRAASSLMDRTGGFEMHLMPWDYAAASLILTEAGGAVCDFDGKAPSLFKPSLFIAANTRENCQRVLDAVHRHLDKLPF